MKISTTSDLSQVNFNPPIQNPDGTVSDIGFERKITLSQTNRIVTDIVPDFHTI